MWSECAGCAVCNVSVVSSIVQARPPPLEACRYDAYGMTVVEAASQGGAPAARPYSSRGVLLQHKEWQYNSRGLPPACLLPAPFAHPHPPFASPLLPGCAVLPPPQAPPAWCRRAAVWGPLTSSAARQARCCSAIWSSQSDRCAEGPVVECVAWCVRQFASVCALPSPPPLSVCLTDVALPGTPATPAVPAAPTMRNVLCWCLQLADMVEAVLADRARLAATGRKAMAKARSWTERDNAAALAGHVERALAGQGGGGAAGVEVAHDDGSGSSKVD